MFIIITVEQDFLGLLELRFKYHKPYIERVKQIGATFDSANRIWVLDSKRLHLLEREFKGELYFKTPLWEIKGEPMPDYSDMYKFDTDCDIDNLGLKLPPYTYQNFGIRFLVDRLENKGMAFIADAVGLGKTLQAIGAFKHFVDSDSINSIVVVCKKSLKYQWAEEIQRFIDFDGTIYIADKSKKKRDAIYEKFKTSSEKTILIINYHLLLKDSKDIKADMVIYDEVHVAKNKDGEINKSCREITKKAKYCLFLTGTPIMSKPVDIYGIIAIKDKKYFGNYSDFKKRYLVEVDKWGYTDIVGYKNLDELREKIQTVILRRTENEVAIELPKIVEMNKNCAIDATQKKALIYVREMSDKREDEIEALKIRLKGSKDIKLKEKYEQMKESMKGFIAIEQIVANSPLLLGHSNSQAIRKQYEDYTPKNTYISSKVEMLLSLCEDIKESESKVIVFTKYKTSAEYLVAALKKAGIQSISYTGEMNDKERNEAINSFKTNEEVTALIGTDAMSEGLNLQFANHLINFDLPFNNSIYLQRMGRIRRSGSVHSTGFIYNLLTEDTIDYKLYGKIKDTELTFDSFISSDKAQSKLLKKISN